MILVTPNTPLTLSNTKIVSSFFLLKLDFQSYSSHQQHNDSSLNNTFSQKFYPVNEQILPVEYINESKLYQIRSKTFDEFHLIDSSLKSPICQNSSNKKTKTYRGRECFRARKTSQYSEEELLMSKHCLILENERIRAENEYRQLINLPDERKTIKDKKREEQLVTKIAQLVETQDRLSTELDIIRLRSNSNIF